MPSVHNNTTGDLNKTREISRVVSRSVSPANGLASREMPTTAPRSQEKSARGPSGSRPPREPRRIMHASNSHESAVPPQRENSVHGLTLSDFAAKVEKEHYMTVMQAEKTALGWSNGFVK
ncbi:hypothetical protein OESDEN_07375 [Oesophagostomum dentatum]|uniref:Uncharacterized protein n=1 Tax=Oesophagostomum dentatum TaxID=61180 RepID=A0A0B1TAA4_OESDE|nr:hypothetical protein OESDEN_07375 [Oesophagostomum dentatum]